ncbi:LysR family transcriptional regulator [Afifella sp. H1R]|uniref:LysR family transcriptional regulator n=1 Tax=Afifella sp. H1R TaxID=2908841 RepID=UPI001F1D93A7|nr:LysR family transcriptional regulator [Afifella sp. H1R]MCF1505158.1 LysR family transcriptional regulator [Afifella sp. H1R]
MARNLDIALLRTFATVADQGSMTRASDILHLTQGAISQQIARLEALVGTALLLRHPRGLRLTPAGERFLGRIRPLIITNDEIWSEIERGDVSGPVRLGLPFDLVDSCFAASLKSYCEAFPKVELTLVCAASPDLLDMVGRGHLDLAVIERAVDSEGGEVLAIDRLVWVGARAGQAHKRSPLPISLVGETCVFRPAVSEALAEEKLASRMVFETGGLDATRIIVKMDLAISAWLASTVPADFDIISEDAGLPPLPSFAITLHRANGARGAIFDELARQLRNAMARPRLAA